YDALPILEILKLGWFTRLRLEAYSLQFTAYSLKLTAYGLTPNLKLTIPRCARKGNDIAYIGHTGNEHHQSFESESKTGVLAGSKFSGFEVPPHVLFGYAHFFATSR